jgi:hypothetical protein
VELSIVDVAVVSMIGSLNRQNRELFDEAQSPLSEVFQPDEMGLERVSKVRE